MIYWDYNATTPCAPEVVEAMQLFWKEEYGNPSSSHVPGKKAAQALALARKQVASLAKCQPSEITFTSGATESNNIVFLGLLLSGYTQKGIATSTIEHKSVLEPIALLSEKGFKVCYLPVTSGGVIDIDSAKKIIKKGHTALVSVQAANNEIGTIQPITEIAEIAHEAGAYLHVDAAQGLGKIPIDLDALGCDFASFSAHKLYGPKGVGALFIKGGSRRWPWAFPIRGGGQEGGIRPGSSNVPGIVGFGAACELAKNQITSDIINIIGLRTELENGLIGKIPQCVIHGYSENRLPGTISVAFPGLQSDLLIAHSPNHIFSKGSACSAGALGYSHVLEQLTLDPEILGGTVRISLGRHTSITDINKLIDHIDGIYKKFYKLKKTCQIL